MKLSFVEAPDFSGSRDELFGKETVSGSYPRLQSALIDNPRAGDVMQGTGGARKVRWGDPVRGKGKRGGIRVIYDYHEESSRILFLGVYNKNISDLTADEKAEIAQLIRIFREEAARRQGQS